MCNFLVGEDVEEILLLEVSQISHTYEGTEYFFKRVYPHILLKTFRTFGISKNF